MKRAKFKRNYVQWHRDVNHNNKKKLRLLPIKRRTDKVREKDVEKKRDK